jgi:putative membrane protein
MKMRVALLFCMTVGFAVTVWLVIANGPAAIWKSIAMAGWGLSFVVMIRAIIIITNGFVWSGLIAPIVNVPPYIIALSRWIREATNVLLPVANIGGEVVGTRVLTFWNVSGPIAVASVVADVLLQTSAQTIFTLFGALLLARLIDENAMLWMLVGTAAAMAVLGIFYFVQRYVGAPLIDRAISALSLRWLGPHESTGQRLQDAIESVWRNRRRVIATLIGHLMAWVIGTFEVWVALRIIGHPVSLQTSLILESVGSAIGIAAFFVPGGWGVQEAGYIFVGRLVGLPTETALALSLIKRVPDFVLGIPGLFAWYALEASHLYRGRKPT